ncbi:MAG: hypothetical protein CMP78_00640 [Formosa sp.]|jgi:hypothetical protein|nr:hypothetical protein [Formosa sp.]
MKKKLESELISIAHRVLKLTGREDLNKMQNEVALLYQKISILKFLQTHFNGEIPEEVATDASFFNALEGAVNNKVSDTAEIDEKVYVNMDNQPNEPLMEPATEKIKDIVAQMPQETTAVDALVDDVNSSDVVEEDLSELSPSFGQLPIFEPLDSDSEPEETLAMDDSLTAIKKTSLDEKLKKTGFQIGLNDRLAFVNHLFQNNNEDYDRVISQLNTMDSFEEISDFIQNIIKPDYSNWEDKGDYETRFLEILQQKFN